MLNMQWIQFTFTLIIVHWLTYPPLTYVYDFDGIIMNLKKIVLIHVNML